jgi:hypothetical protein
VSPLWLADALARHWRAGVLAILVASTLWQGLEARRAKGALAACRAAQAALKIEAGRLNAAIAERDRRIEDQAAREAEALGRADRDAAAEISNAFRRGVAVGRADSHANELHPKAPAVPAAGVRDAGRVRDYRQAREAAAYRPGA